MYQRHAYAVCGKLQEAPFTPLRGIECRHAGKQGALLLPARGRPVCCCCCSRTSVVTSVE
jgi:hypothetical protein